MVSRRFLRIIRYPPRFLYALGLGPLYGRLVLLLTTTGRRSGRPRVTPLQYEQVDGEILVASIRGVEADWFRNLVADPRVEVRVGSRRFHALAEPVTNPARVADFLTLRLQHHPRMVGAILRAQGLAIPPSRADLETYAQQRAVVVIRPVVASFDGSPSGG